ncbi:MAG: hypothetical protein INR70_07080 [Parafilimonas terrae]|jgi:hypothetical protein|nr:hypothetical protein [Parafilimonas terrae]
MFESWFLGPALVVLFGTAALVAIGARRQPPIAGRAYADPRLSDPRRVFGRKRRWRRAPGPGPVRRRGLPLMP